jgi:cytochrome c-type biogenesis protein CcmF
MGDLGFILLSVALATTAYACVGLALGARTADQRLVRSSKRGVYASTALVTLAVLALLYSLLARDFRLEYVASHTSRDLALPYTVSALWAGQEGSLLFWAWLLSIFASVIALGDRRRQNLLFSYASMVMAGTLAFFLMLLVVLANPFRTLGFVPADGLGMNPLLQNPAMLWHPPIIFLGYVGFTVPFAFTMAVLISGRLKESYVQWVRRWTLFPWLCLGVGTILGAQWAYVELGWGGYWAWDPVENASLLPWLTGTALVHSFMLRGTRVRISHIALAVTSFALCIFGTFITRSGMIGSVHAFSVSSIGLYFLGFLAVVIAASVVLTIKRRAGLRSDEEATALVSRPSALLLTIVLLVAAAAAILIGTLFPLVSDVLNVALTSDYFNLSTAVIMGPLILVMGICPFTTWKGGSLRSLVRYLVVPVIGGVLTAVLLVLVGVREPFGVLAFSICSVVAITTVYQFFSGLRTGGRPSGSSWLSALASAMRRQSRRHGAYVVHLGIVFITLGVVGSSAYKTEEWVTLDPGASQTVGSYTLRYDEFSFQPALGKDVATVTLSVLQGPSQVGVLRPEKQFYHTTQQPVSEVAIRTTLRDDLYVALAGWEEDSEVIDLQVIVSPLQVWIWIGGAVLLLGAAIALWPARRGDSEDRQIEEAIEQLRQSPRERPGEDQPR